MLLGTTAPAPPPPLMSTRTLIILALLCGVLILVAGTVQILLIRL